MRIVFATSYYPPYAVGGAEESAFALARALRGRGHDVEVYVPLLGPLSPEDPQTSPIDLGYRVERPGVPVRSRVFDRPRVQTRFARALAAAAGSADLIHVQTLDLLPAAWVAARRAGVPLVASIRDLSGVCSVSVCLLEAPRVPPDCGVIKLERQCVPRFRELYGGSAPRTGAAALVRFATARGRARLLRDCDAVVSVGSDLGRLYADAGLVEPRTVVHIPNIAEAPTGGQTSGAEYGLVSGSYAVYGGKVSHGKGSAYLLAAAKKARQVEPDFVLAVAGNATEDWQSQLQDAEPVRYLGRLPRAELMELYRHARFAVVPSIWPEPFGRATVEAAAAGVTAIGTRTGGIPDVVIHRETGLLVEPRDTDALCDAIVTLWRDPDWARSLGDRAKRRVIDHFSPNVVADATFGLYEEVLSRTRASPRASAA